MDISGLGLGTALGLGQTGKYRENHGEDGDFAGLLKGGEVSTTDEAWKLLQEMTEGGLAGYWKWMVKTMREKLREEVMGGMGISEEQLAAMPEAQRKDIEAKITEEVERRLKAWVEQQVRKQQDVADQQKLEQTLAALGVAAELTNPEEVAEGKKQPAGDWIDQEGVSAGRPAGALLPALPLTPEQLEAAGYKQDDVARMIIEGLLRGDTHDKGGTV